MDTSELDKMAAVREQSQAIGEFIEWLQGKGVVLAEWKGSDLTPYHYGSIEQLLADYFGIDLAKVERERREILRILGG